MSKSSLHRTKHVLYPEDGKTKVLLFDPRDSSKDQAFADSLSKLKPCIKIDFQWYDLNKKTNLFYPYLDLKYYASEIAEELGNEQLKKIVNAQSKRGIQWAKAGSQIPISNLLKCFAKEFYEEFNRYPWVVLANIDVETEVNHATVGSIVFEVVTNPMATNVILTCTPENWTSFEKGRDIFARIASRLRSCVKRL